MLGPFEVACGGDTLPLGSPKQRALLAALVASANRVVSVDRLMEELWGDEPPERAIASLQAYVSRLRRLLQPEGGRRGRSDVLVTQPPGYLLRVDPESIDAVRFERDVLHGVGLLRAGDASGAVVTLDRALRLWRGDPYADFGYEEFAQREIARLRELRLGALEARLGALIESDQAVTAVAEAEAVVREEPLREGVWASLVTALYRAGRQGDALRAYQRARRALAEELGIEPGPALQELEARMLDQTLDVGPAQPPLQLSSGVRAADPAPPRDPLVGRDGERGRLRAAVADMGGGRGRTVLLHGEPGIGKTRLARDAAERAAGAGAVVGWGACVEGDVTTAYWPWTSALRAVLGEFDTGDLPDRARVALAELAQLDPALGRWAGQVPAPPAPADPEVARARLRRATLDALLGLSCLRPIAVVLEDLQWADAPSLQLLSLGSAELGPAPVLLVVTYRDHEVDAALASTLRAIARVEGSIDVPLTGLDEASVHRYVELTVGEQVSGALAATIAARTAGNPLFVGELTRLLRSERALDDDGVRRAPVPAGVREVIRRRLDRLPPQTNTVLTMASVIGRRFELPVLARVAELSEDDLLDRVESAVAVGLIREISGTDAFEFAHDLIRETLHDGVSGTRRARLHARVARALLEQDGDADATRTLAIAHHLLEALPSVKAEDVARHVIVASDAAVSSLAFEQAEQLLGRALDLVEVMPADSRDAFELAARVRLARALTFLRGHASSEVIEQSRRAGELADVVEPRPEAVRALWAVAIASAVAGDVAKATAVCRRLLTWGEQRNDASAECVALNGLGAFSWWVGDVSAALGHSARAVELADGRELDDFVVFDDELRSGTSARIAQATAAWLSGDGRRADEYMADAVRRAESPGNEGALPFARCYDAFLAVLRRDHERARRRSHEAIERADAMVNHSYSLHARLLAAAASETRGRASEIASLVDAWEASGAHLYVSFFLGLQAEAELESGQLDEAVDTLNRALDLVAATGERFYEPELHRLRGDSALRCGRRDEAVRHYERALEIIDELGLACYRVRAEASLDGVRDGAC